MLASLAAHSPNTPEAFLNAVQWSQCLVDRQQNINDECNREYPNSATFRICHRKLGLQVRLHHCKGVDNLLHHCQVPFLSAAEACIAAALILLLASTLKCSHAILPANVLNTGNLINVGTQTTTEHVCNLITVELLAWAAPSTLRLDF